MLISYGSFPECGDRCGRADVRMIVGELVEIRYITEAEQLDAQVMELRKKLLGAEHPDTLTSIANLASTYKSQGRWNEAAQMEVHVMDMRKKLLGAEHPDTITSMANVGCIYRDQGRVCEAEKLEHEVMNIKVRIGRI